jgi:hypothetical protein
MKGVDRLGRLTRLPLFLEANDCTLKSLDKPVAPAVEVESMPQRLIYQTLNQNYVGKYCQI